MPYLLDTNIFLEILLDQDKSEECKKLIEKMLEKRISLYISDFSFFSIAIRMSKEKKVKEFLEFKKELIDSGYIKIARLEPSEEFDEAELSLALERFSFDDAYQYLLCKVKAMELITLDSDFQNVEDVKVHTPEELLKMFKL